MKLLKILRLSAAACVLSGFTGCNNFDRVMAYYGYTVLRPASTLLSPGALVAITHRDPFVAKIICGPRASLGSGFKPLESATSNRSLTSKTTGTFSVDADMLSQITADATFSSISNLTVTLSDARIVEVTDADILSNIKYRSQECREAVNARRRAGFEITMVSSALIANMSYNVSFSQNSHLDAKAKVDVLSNLAVRLGGGATRVGDNHIESRGLALGIRDDEYLSALALEDVDEKAFKRGSRIIESGKAPVLDITPDAPVVYPTDGQDGEQEYCDIHGNCTNGATPVIGAPPIETRRRPGR